jgi:hypothetical protein
LKARTLRTTADGFTDPVKKYVFKTPANDHVAAQWSKVPADVLQRPAYVCALGGIEDGARLLRDAGDRIVRIVGKKKSFSMNQNRSRCGLNSHHRSHR